MDASTAAIAADAARIREGQELKLRVMQHKYAAQIAAQARAIERHARKLRRLLAKINAEATAIAGVDFAEHHTLWFDEYESIAAQQANNEGGCSVGGAEIVDVIEMATAMANRADRVAACRIPSALLSD